MKTLTVDCDISSNEEKVVVVASVIRVEVEIKNAIVLKCRFFPESSLH